MPPMALSKFSNAIPCDEIFFNLSNDHTTHARILNHAWTLKYIGSSFSPASMDTAGLIELGYHHAPTFIFPPDRCSVPLFGAIPIP